MKRWRDKTIMVTGGAGFLGSHVVERLRNEGCQRIIVPRSREYDLRNPQAIRELLTKTAPDLIIHLAASVGGIEANRKNPGSFFYDNLSMGIHLMEAARLCNVEKFVACGTICSYPKFASVPFREEDLWDGYPEETNAPYGLAKKMLLVQSQAYRQQYGFNSIFLLPVNLYGPRDNFDLETSHVIPALIRKCLEAKQQNKDHITVWGSGKVTREFIYVEEAAEAILLASEHFDGEQSVNIGTGEEITIRVLAELIAEETGFVGEFRWDSEKPDGQPRRCLDVRKAKDYFGFESKVSLREGVRKTIQWYANLNGGGTHEQ
ncbi:GDP-L-fucose synthase [Brevibacillus choshinensis]|uniref:GDP-L-fucose synthase family protein n=1 Tax=Brevibacillus choshinensis TaxID=54911 RepID=UPI002E205BD0|nr:GDP-L-fucose synthase [Brevibacillus choshinensis]MED4753921.1 GDP-L-fucose synthase [Brevibacillus choshinensis]MED4779051.1 GDP-L-fucose synthase [Brevibacillus choshinensis]